jgi:hypothetical protein
MSEGRPVSLLRLWWALLLRRTRYPNARLWMRGDDGQWHNVDDWSQTR